MAQGGFALDIPPAQLFYELLPAHHVMIHARRGVKIRGLWYDGSALDAYRDGPSGRGGRHKGRWVIRRDPRDARFVFFQDPATHEWHTLRWSGLPAEGEVPSFNDARVRELLARARKVGLVPQREGELLPMLLELLGVHAPVDGWPTQPTKRERTEHAREADQGLSAHTDRPASPQSLAAAGGSAVALRRPDRVRDGVGALDAERRRRRLEAVPGAPEPPPRLGAGLRRASLFILADEDGPASSTESASDSGQDRS